MKFFLITVFDGYYIGLKESFDDTFLQANSLQDAIKICNHWNAWLLGSECICAEINSRNCPVHQ